MSHPKKPNRFRTLRLESLQTRDLMAVDFAGLLRSGDLPTYSIDGSANNASNLEWGSTNEKFLRLARSEYADGVLSVAGETAPSARAVSNALADQGSQDTVSNKNLSAFVYAWGQFLDHDITLTNTGNEVMLIPVPKGDTYSDNRRQPREVGLGNWTVELVDSEGTLVSSVRSLPNGSYRFDVQTGIRTDDYTIRITKDPQGRLLPEPMSRNASITRGDQWVNRVDFGVPPSRPAGRSATSGLNSANSLQAPLVDSVAASSMDQILSEAELRRQSRRR